MRIVLMSVALLVVAAHGALAQESAPPQAANPWAERPQCASMFMNADWQLSDRQRLCRFMHNGVFSTSAMFGAAWSAYLSQQMDDESERGDGYLTRFGRRFGQNAFKSLGEYAGTYIAREDPRRSPPYLVMRASPRGFFPRLGHALGANVMAYRCVEGCTDAAHIRRTPAVSKILGSLASGASAELMTRDRPNSVDHALRGAASAYASTFMSAAVNEFQPEVSAAAARIFTSIFGVR